MANFEYYGFMFKQLENMAIPKFFMFHAPVGEILEWADIRRLEDTPGTGAPQRTTSPAKVKAVKKFMEDEQRNSIPTAIILTIDVPQENIVENISCDGIELTSLCQIKISIDGDAKKPGLVIDGQHRLLGLKQVNPDCQVSVVSLLNVGDEEKAFQFLVINNKSTKVSSDHIRALALSFQEDDLKNRLKAARLSLSPNLDFVGIVNSEEGSPFKGIISWPINPEPFRIVVPSSIELAISKIQLKKVKPFESDDVLLEFFYSIWNTIKNEWASIWNQDSKLLQKIGIVCMTEYISDALISYYDWGRLDISSPDEVSCAVKELLQFQEKLFWALPWTSASYDTKAGRELVLDSLVKIGRNLRSGDIWHEGLEIVIRTKANNQRWVYQIAIVDEGGKVVIDPCVMCSQCGGTLQWKPHVWNPFSKMPMEWKPLGKFIDADRSAAHAKAHAEDMYQRALKAEELLYRFYIDRDKKAEEAIIKFVQDGLDKEGL